MTKRHFVHEQEEFFRKFSRKNGNNSGFIRNFADAPEQV